MNPLDLNKDSEIVPGEITEKPFEIIEVTETTEVVEVPKKTRAPRVAKTPKTEEVIVETTLALEVSPEIVAVEQHEEEKPTHSHHVTSSKTQLIESLKVLIDKEVDAVKDEVETIKQFFYKKAKAEIEELKKTFTEENGEEIEFTAPKD